MYILKNERLEFINPPPISGTRKLLMICIFLCVFLLPIPLPPWFPTPTSFQLYGWLELVAILSGWG